MQGDFLQIRRSLQNVASMSAETSHNVEIG